MGTDAKGARDEGHYEAGEGVTFTGFDGGLRKLDTGDLMREN